MEKQQEQEWAEAQKITVTVDLVAAAKQQLRFLAEVDRNRDLYDGAGLDRAIHRYKYCWLPLLAKHAEAPVVEGLSLVVPLDCEWIWHCHRLNPIRYKNDCEELYGRILDNKNVVSSTQATCSKQSEEIWRSMYPDEPYEFNMSSHFPEKAGNISGAPKSINYDLVSAVKRQAPFFYQVSRSHMNDHLFLEEAAARYKGFLHLIKRNWERSLRRFCVPTYDIDLIWHSHQLNPDSYCKDLVAALGKVLEHDDTDSDRTEGKKLDNGFSGTTKQWEETFGLRYWRVGAMYRGNSPSPLPVNLGQLETESKTVVPSSNEYHNSIQLQRKMIVEIMLEIVGVRDLPHGHKGSLFATLHKKGDTFFNIKRRLSIFSETRRKWVTLFQCEPAGELVFELMSHGPSALAIAKHAKTLGTTIISLTDLVNPVSQLSVEKWFSLESGSGFSGSKPISMRIALSFTPPRPAPYQLHMVQRGSFSNSCFFPLPRKLLHLRSSRIVDETDSEVITMEMRDSLKMEARRDLPAKKEVIGVPTSGKKLVLAESSGPGWFLMNSNWLFQVHKKFSEDGYAFELQGSRKVIVFPGRKLEYEINNKKKQKGKQHFMTAVEFSPENPYGKAVALLNLKSGFIKINEESLVLPMIVLVFILSNCSSKARDGPYGGLTTEADNL
ncbi:hypothetical protein SLA2020_333210 [Shorea laevis]